MPLLTQANRIDNIAPFYVMDLLSVAKDMEAKGQEVIHLEIGEPDFSAPKAVVTAMTDALLQGLTHYTPALGLPELRDGLSAFYATKYGAEVASKNIAITPGASGALQLVMGAIVNPGDEVILADPGYPCNRHFIRLMEGRDIGVPVDATSQFQLTAALIEQHLTAKTKAVLIASPSNPTGTLVPCDELEKIMALCQQHQVFLIVDEIYMGLTYDVKEQSAAQYCGADNEHVIVINSFSKYFGMTGLRCGWLIAPMQLMSAINIQAQNFFLAASTSAQYGALAALTANTEKELEQRRQAFQARRDYLLPELRRLGFKIDIAPQGAFYLYADCSGFTEDSFAWCFDVLKHTGVAITPGKDFGAHQAHRFVRFAYTRDIDTLQRAVQKLEAYLG